MAETELPVATGNGAASVVNRPTAVDLLLPELAPVNRLAHRFQTRPHLEQGVPVPGLSVQEALGAAKQAPVGLNR